MVIHLFGDRLKELRKECNLTQEDIGNLCGVAKNTVSNYKKTSSIFWCYNRLFIKFYSR